MFYSVLILSNENEMNNNCYKGLGVHLQYEPALFIKDLIGTLVLNLSCLYHQKWRSCLSSIQMVYLASDIGFFTFSLTTLVGLFIII